MQGVLPVAKRLLNVVAATNKIKAERWNNETAALVIASGVKSTVRRHAQVVRGLSALK